MERKTKYELNFEYRYVDERIQVKFVSFFLNEIKRKISILEKEEEDSCVAKITAKGQEFAYYWPGISVVESLVKALGYDATQSRYKVEGNDEYSYEWKIKKQAKKKDLIDLAF